ncbi:Rv1733c family protein [Streptomyces angustmyceticus]|uniref:Rv1733c family protein n=1 Tax=Streptomyces angustmyceticus TaxID=285578 RepID=UPI003D8D9A3E
MPLQKIHLPRRDNPLQRGTDVAQSWMLLITAVLTAVAVPAAGVMAGSALDASSQRQGHDQKSVSAVLTEDSPARIGVDPAGGTGGRVHATVRWTAPDGTTRTGETAVAPGLRAGDRTTAWVDRHGSLLRDPTIPGDALAESVAVGIVAASATGLLFLGANKAGVVLLNRRRYAEWEKDWAESDLRWRQGQP